MTQKSFRLIIILIFSIAVLAKAGDIKKTKQNLSSYDCAYFEFLSTLDSKVFDVIDSVHGQAYIAQDGRYYVEIGPDIFLYDGDTLFSFFRENNQLIIEKPDPEYATATEISFVMKLNDWYDSKALKEKNSYKMTKKENVGGDIPDSMIIKIDDKTSALKIIEYFDSNEDLNRIEILNHETDSICDSGRFTPAFPDSVEKVRL